MQSKLRVALIWIFLMARVVQPLFHPFGLHCLESSFRSAPIFFIHLCIYLFNSIQVPLPVTQSNPHESFLPLGPSTFPREEEDLCVYHPTLGHPIATHPLILK